MRLTDHETSPSTPAIPPERLPSRAPPDPSSEDGVARNPAEAPAIGERSSQRHALHRARAVAQAVPEVRLAQVEAAHCALQEGTLTLGGQSLAEKLLQAARTERRHA